MYRRSGALTLAVGVKFLTLGTANKTVNGAEKDMTSNCNYRLPGLHTEPYKRLWLHVTSHLVKVCTWSVFMK